MNDSSGVTDYGIREIEQRRIRPPRRRKPYTLRAILANLVRDLRVWWKWHR